VLAIMLVISSLIGVYYRFTGGKQRTRSQCQKLLTHSLQSNLKKISIVATVKSNSDLKVIKTLNQPNDCLLNIQSISRGLKNKQKKRFVTTKLADIIHSFFFV
jgi:hypothetical protein